jgi:hypothetical protein
MFTVHRLITRTARLLESIDDDNALDPDTDTDPDPDECSTHVMRGLNSTAVSPLDALERREDKESGQ